jgi:hypothetical protein
VKRSNLAFYSGERDDKKESAKTEEGVTFALEPFVVNLSDPTLSPIF